MDKVFVFSIIYLIGVLISAFAQVLLKKSADIEQDNIIKEYLNPKTIVAYIVFFAATLCTVLAYKYVPLSMGPVLGTAEYIFVALLGFLLLKEKISKQKIFGLCIIVVGILVFTI